MFLCCSLPSTPQSSEIHRSSEYGTSKMMSSCSPRLISVLSLSGKDKDYFLAQTRYPKVHFVTINLIGIWFAWLILFVWQSAGLHGPSLLQHDLHVCVAVQRRPQRVCVCGWASWHEVGTHQHQVRHGGKLTLIKWVEYSISVC